MQWKHRVLSAGLPGKPHKKSFLTYPASPLGQVTPVNPKGFCTSLDGSLSSLPSCILVNSPFVLLILYSGFSYWAISESELLMITLRQHDHDLPRLTTQDF